MRKMTKKIVACVMAASVAAVSPGVTSLQENTSIEAQAARKKLTKKQARKKVVKYLKKNKIWNKDYYLEYDHKSGNKYVFHYYEMMSDHTATVNWYDVNIRTGKITPEF